MGAENAVLTAAAHQVRGKWILDQEKGSDIQHGVATSSTALLEGIFGAFESIDFPNGGTGGDSITILGSFGGLTGTIDQTANGLNFSVLGKALSEGIDFSGKFDQASSRKSLYRSTRSGSANSPRAGDQH
jgi:hypothetical protein